MEEAYFIHFTGPCISPFDGKEKAERFMKDLEALMDSYGVNPHWIYEIETESRPSWATL